MFQAYNPIIEGFRASLASYIGIRENHSIKWVKIDPRTPADRKKSATLFYFDIFSKFLRICVSYIKGKQQKNVKQNLRLLPSIAHS